MSDVRNQVVVSERIVKPLFVWEGEETSATAVTFDALRRQDFARLARTWPQRLRLRDVDEKLHVHRTLFSEATGHESTIRLNFVQCPVRLREKRRSRLRALIRRARSNRLGQAAGVQMPCQSPMSRHTETVATRLEKAPEKY